MKLQADLANPRSLIEILSRTEHWQRTLDWTVTRWPGILALSLGVVATRHCLMLTFTKKRRH